MRIILESEVTTSTKSFFAYPYYQFNGQNQATKYFNVPLLQREYIWPEKGQLKELLWDLYHHCIKLPNTPPFPINPTDNSSYYYTGTILCESQDTVNAFSDQMSLVDGQQRITSIYLMNFVGYLLARLKLENLPVGLSSKRYIIELTTRFTELVKWENRCFVKSNLSDDIITLFNDNDEENATNLTESFQVRIGSLKRKNELQNELWINLHPRLKFNDTTISRQLKQTLELSELSREGDYISFYSINNNNYSSGIETIISILNDLVDSSLQAPDINRPIHFDERISKMLNYIESYLSHLGMTCIISQNENDSFYLFEVLNERGQDLTALDLVKNMILESVNQNFNNGIYNFEGRWRELKNRVSQLGDRKKADSNFINFFIRSESSTTTSKQIAYLRNRQDIERAEIFRDEQINNFFLRLEKASQILHNLYTNSRSQNVFNNHKASCFQYSTFMRMISYDWGQQVILGSNLLYLVASQYQPNAIGTYNCLDDNNNWTTNQTLSAQPDLKHFSRFLSDILLKIGLVGIINKLSENLLPVVSKKILLKIIKYSSDKKNQPQQIDNPFSLRELINSIIQISNEILNDANKENFKARLNSEFYANTPAKKNIAKVLLYLIYNRNAILQYNDPELEHFEPVNPQGINPPQIYNQGDRLLVIHKLGNLFLIDRNINQRFTNLSISQKLTLARTEFPDYDVFRTNLFLNVDFEQVPRVVNDTIHGNLPEIKIAQGQVIANDDAFLSDGTPTPYFFKVRTELLSNLAAKYIFEDGKFLNGSSIY
jgi:hypothetical protein